MAIIKLMNYSDTSNNTENVNANNYSLLHKALQLTSFKANKCIGTSLFERYKFSLIDTIYNKFTKPYFLAKEENNISSANSFDLFSESLLMISILDDKINISDDLYNYVINSQLPNGGWGINNDNSGSNGHATIVSLWVLLDLHKKLISVAKMPK